MVKFLTFENALILTFCCGIIIIEGIWKIFQYAMEDCRGKQ